MLVALAPRPLLLSRMDGHLPRQTSSIEFPSKPTGALVTDRRQLRTITELDAGRVNPRSIRRSDGSLSPSDSFYRIPTPLASGT